MKPNTDLRWQSDWDYDEEGYRICPGCHESMLDSGVREPRNHAPDCPLFVDEPK